MDSFARYLLVLVVISVAKIIRSHLKDDTRKFDIELRENAIIVAILICYLLELYVW